MQKFYCQLYIVLLLSASLKSYAQVQDAWIKTDIGHFVAKTESPGLVLDANGNVIAGVNTRDYNFEDEIGWVGIFKLSKFKPDGTKLFEVVDPMQIYNKTLVGMAVDNAGNTYCAVQEWRVLDPAHAVVGSLFAVYKYGPTGNVIWRRSYGDGQYSAPNALALDPAGNVYLTGFCKVSGAQGTNELPDYLTVKWSSAGDIQWARKYDGASPGEGFNVARAISVDGSGNVYITGQSQRDGQLGYATLKYNSAGTQLWAQRYTGVNSGNDNALAITHDISGFIYVTGGSDGSIATLKYNNDGAQIWVQREGSGGGEGRAIKVDVSGNVFVGGNNSQTTMGLVKYNPSGIKQWSSSRGGAGYSLEIDGNGNSYISGTYLNDAAVLKFNSSGLQQWIKTYDSPLITGILNPLAVSDLDNVYAIRFSSYINKNGIAVDYYVADLIKLTQCDLICPQDITINTAPGQCTAVVNYEVGVTGECGSNIATSQPSGTALPVGTTIVAVVSIATGEHCSFNVTVVDAEAPQVRCRNITVALNGIGNANITAAQVDNGSTDNCGIQSRTLSKTSFTCKDIGTNTVTLTVTDVNGNTASCSATVTIRDNTPPVAMCKNATVYLDGVGSASITTTDIDNGSSDACGAVTLSLSKTSFTCADKGANTVVLTVTDPYNNTATCSATVTVVDDLPPIISSVTADPANLWPSDRKMKKVNISADVSDNCPNVTWSVTGVGIKSGIFPYDNINPDYEITGQHKVELRAEAPFNGTTRVYVVTITAIDEAGNTSVASVDVAVAPDFITNVGTGRQLDVTEELKPLVENLSVAAYPNPFNRQFSLRITSPVSGMATIEFYTLSGAHVYMDKKPVTAGVGNIFRYPGLHKYGNLVYRVTIGERQAAGILIKTD